MNTRSQTHSNQRFGASLPDLLVWVVLIVVCVGVIYFAWQRDQRSAAMNMVMIPTPAGVNAPEFTFTDQSNTVFTNEQLKGKVWVADFIFTNCAGPCPLMTQRMSKLQSQVGAHKDVAYVSVTCDPDRDTPEVLHAYGEDYSADFSTWSFLTGPYEDVQKLANGFLLSVERPYEEAARLASMQDTGVPDDASPPTKISSGAIIHSTRFILVNRKGEVVGWYDSSDMKKMTQLRDDLSALLDAGP